MKQCPACNRTYVDDSQSFCLMDGTSLIIESGEKTIVMQTSPVQPVHKKTKFLLWLGVGGLVLLVVGGVIVGLLVYEYRNQADNVRGERQASVNLSPSPTLPSTLTPTPTSVSSSPIEEPSPKVEESKPTRTTEDTADITPIDWSTSASGFQGAEGKTLRFRCPEKGTAQIIWGSDVYSDDSSICTAAVHAGLFTLDKGGMVTIEYRPGRSIYGSTVRNGIKSNTEGEYPRSFVVR